MVINRFFRPLQVRAAAAGPLNGVRSYASEAKAAPTEVSSILEQRIRGVSEEAGLAETGRVLSVGYVNCPWAAGGREKNSVPGYNSIESAIIYQHSTTYGHRN